MGAFLSSPPGIAAALGLAALVIHALATRKSGPGVLRMAPTSRTFIVQVVLSGVVLAAALYIILSQGYPADTEKWAAGTIGLILGFWLKSVV